MSIMENPEKEQAENTVADASQTAITTSVGTWNTLLNVFKVLDNDVVFRRSDDMVEFYTIDPAHVLTARAKLSMACEGDGQGLVFVKDMLDFVKAFDKNAVLRYTFKKLDGYSCEVRLEARGQLEGFKTFRRMIVMPAEAFPEPVIHTAEASTNIKTLKHLFNNINSHRLDTVKVSIGENALALETRDDEDVKQFSAPVNTTASLDRGYYNGSMLTKMVKSLPDTAITVKISILKAADSKPLAIDVFLPQGYLNVVMLPRDEDW